VAEALAVKLTEEQLEKAFNAICKDMCDSEVFSHHNTNMGNYYLGRMEGCKAALKHLGVKPKRRREARHEVL